MQNIKPPCNSWTPYIQSPIQEQAVHNKRTFCYRRCSASTHPKAPTSGRHPGLPARPNAAAQAARPARSRRCPKERSTQPKAAPGQALLPTNPWERGRRAGGHGSGAAGGAAGVLLPAKRRTKNRGVTGDRDACSFATTLSHQPCDRVGS